MIPMNGFASLMADLPNHAALVTWVNAAVYHIMHIVADGPILVDGNSAWKHRERKTA